MAQDGTSTDIGFTYNGLMATRMACNMGDLKASVLCNILGDEPLFYIDYVDADDSDMIDPLALLGDELAADLTTEYMAENVGALRQRISRLERASQHIDGYPRASIEVSFDAATAGLTHFTTPEEIMAELANSRSAMAMFADCRARTLSLVLNPQVDLAVYDRDHTTIHVNPRLPAAMAALVTTRALRQAWLHLRGAAINPLSFAPEEAILLNRIQHADLACAVVRTAWEMNLSGARAAWGRILTGSAYDLAAGFAREAIADFRALNNGQAAHATFERWFFSGRCKDVDRRLIQQMLADHHGLVFENPAVSRMVTGDVIARTGDLALGRNYLSSLVEIVLSDPLFTEVRDRSNANFLWFIKFERSFRAAEADSALPLEVMQAATPAHAEIAQPRHNAEIITFNTALPSADYVPMAKTGTDDMATVYYLDHFLTLSNR